MDITPLKYVFGDAVTKFPVILSSAAACTLLYIFSHRFFESASKSYQSLSKSKQIDWNIHVVSFVHAVTIIIACLPIFVDPKIHANPIFAKSEYALNVYSIACGYFLFDVIMSLRYIKLFGVGFVVHGVASFFVYLFVLRPYLTFYAAIFLMYELSTPFLNIHWFCDKAGLTGSKLQLFNGILLLITFFGARIASGFYFSYLFWVDSLQILKLGTVPGAIVIYYLVSNIILNSLNVFWFYKMIVALLGRFSNKSNKRI